MRRNEHLNILLVFSIFIALTLMLLGCNKQTGSYIITNQKTLTSLGTQVNSTAEDKDCLDPLNYIPSDPELYPIRTIRINVHFMDNEKKQHNFGPEDGRKYMWSLIKDANDKLTRNFKMNLPVGNNTPNYHPRYQYKITSTGEKGDDGYYHHYDDKLYGFLNKGRDKNNYDKTVIEKYQIGEDSILNIFVMPHHPDSLKTGRYKSTSTGIALGTGLKIAGLAENRKQPWMFSTLLNHEVGHIFGLRHSWTRHDGCDDTPNHPNCWHPDGTAKCPDPVSNNMMDYNNSQMAITPCQLGIVHRSIANENNSVRHVVSPIWCKLDNSNTINVLENTTWAGSLDLSHNVVVKSGKTLTIKCRVSMPPNSHIIIEPGATLHLDGGRLHNDCGKKWYGIKLLTNKKQQAQVMYSQDAIIENVHAQKS